MEREEGDKQIFAYSLVHDKPYDAKHILGDFYAVESARKRLWAEELGVERDFLVSLSLQVEVEVLERLIIMKSEGTPPSLDESVIAKNMLYGQIRSMGERVEEGFQEQAEQTLIDFTDNTRKQHIFDYCDADDLPSAICSTGGLPSRGSFRIISS